MEVVMEEVAMEVATEAMEAMEVMEVMEVMEEDREAILAWLVQSL